MNPKQMGQRGGRARAKNLSAKRRKEIASRGGLAAKAIRDWKKKNTMKPKLTKEGSKN